MARSITFNSILAFVLSLAMVFGALAIASPTYAQLDAQNTGLAATAGQAEPSGAGLLKEETVKRKKAPLRHR